MGCGKGAGESRDGWVARTVLGWGSIKGNPRLCFGPISKDRDCLSLGKFGPHMGEALISIGRAYRNSKKVT